MQVKVMTTTIKYGDLSVADTTKVQNIFDTTPNVYILNFLARVKTAFAGVTTPTVKLGKSDFTDAYFAKQSIDVTGDLIPKNTLANITSGSLNLEHPSGEWRDYQSAAVCTAHISHQKSPVNIPIVATFESASGDLSSLTAGEIEFIMVLVTDV